MVSDPVGTVKAAASDHVDRISNPARLITDTAKAVSTVNPLVATASDAITAMTSDDPVSAVGEAKGERLFNQTVTAAGEGAGAALGKGVSALSKGVANPIPGRMARVVPGDIDAKTLGAPGANDVFVTAASDIQGMNSSQIANRLTIPESNSGFKVIEFDTPKEGVSSPVSRNNPGFIGGGRTAGGAREFAVSNSPINQLENVRIIFPNN